MLGAGTKKLQGGQRFVVTGGVKVQPLALGGGARSELPPRPSRKISVGGGAASGGGASSDHRRPTSARKSSPEPFTASSATDGRHELQASSTRGGREGCPDDPDKRQRPASARPRLQQAPVCFAPPPEPGTAALPAQADALEWRDGCEGGEELHAPGRQTLAPPPPPSTGTSFTQAEREQDALSWKAKLQGEGRHDTHMTPLARRASASAMQVQPRAQGASGDAASAGKGESGEESDTAPRVGPSPRRQKSQRVWQTQAYMPYARKGEEFSTYASYGGGVELVTALALEPRSPEGPHDPLTGSAGEEGEGGEAQQRLRRYGEAVRDIEFGDVQRLVRGPLRIPMRPRSAVGVSDGVFFEHFEQTTPGGRARRSAPTAPDRALQGPRRVLGWGEGGRGGSRSPGLRATCAQRPVSAGNLGSGGSAGRRWGRGGPAPVASGRGAR